MCVCVFNVKLIDDKMIKAQLCPLNPIDLTIGVKRF